MAGLVYLFRQEIAARIELTVVVLAFLWFFALGRPLADFLVLFVLACILFAVEALNTAVEEVVDKISPERSEFGKHAKDLGSTAVFFMLTAGGVYVAAVTAKAFGLIAWP
jgi:diacylglycerol kinase (ATP)